MSTVRLMQLSGMLQAVHIPQSGNTQQANNTSHTAGLRLQMLATSNPAAELQPATKTPPSALSTFLKNPAVKVVAGLLIGVLALYLISHFIDFPKTFGILRNSLTTPQGILYAFLAAVSFLTAFCMRGTRWKMFLRPITNVSVSKAIQIYLIGIFVNVLLPIQGGEVAKSLLLKRVAGVPVSQSLPTVAMDKSLDLMPALFIMAIVPFIPGIHMGLTLWLILGLVGSILVGMIFVIVLTVWNRKIAIAFIHFMLRLLPRGIGAKIEGFAIGFVDSLLAAASQPKNFIPAVLLTGVAICCDGLFAMFAFWTVGLHMNYGTAIFGYTLFNMFTILPSPPGQVGTNELYGTLVFGQLLGFKGANVLAMFVFSHPLTALLMFCSAMICFSTLGLKLSTALKVQNSPHEEKQHAPTKEASHAFSSSA